MGALLCLAALLPGCMVMAVGGAAVSVTASAVGLAANVAVGSAKLVGKGVGAAVDAMAQAPETEADTRPAMEHHSSESTLYPCQQPSCEAMINAW